MMFPVIVTRPGTALPPSIQLGTWTSTLASLAAVKVRLALSLPSCVASAVPQVPRVILNSYGALFWRSATVAVNLPSAVRVSGTPAASQFPSAGTDPETYSTWSFGVLGGGVTVKVTLTGCLRVS
jgi:hypothetical protein